MVNIVGKKWSASTEQVVKMDRNIQEGERTVKRQIKIYNLDLIISVGYRVNSKHGTAFGIWANKIIKDHLVKGYTINEKRLLELQKIIKLVNRIFKV